MLPGFRWATGSAGPKVGLTFSMVAWKRMIWSGDWAWIDVATKNEQAIKKRLRECTIGLREDRLVEHGMGGESIVVEEKTKISQRRGGL
jgi:hypothetical protein